MLSCWSKTRVQGWAAVVLKEKLKTLKELLRTWDKDVFGVLDVNIAWVNSRQVSIRRGGN